MAQSFFAPGDLDGLQEESLSAMDAVGQILRKAGTGTSGVPYGEIGPDYAPVGDPVRCRVVENGGGREANANEGTASVAPYLVQFDGAVDVRGEDRIAVAFDDGREQTYAVTAPERPVSYQINTRAFVTLAS